MKSTKLTAVTLLMVLVAACFFSTPVLADHPWDIDKGTDTRGTTDVGGTNLNEEKQEATPITTSSASSDATVQASWLDTIRFVYDYFVPIQLKPYGVDVFGASGKSRHSRR
jgi:hypothetical protein